MSETVTTCGYCGGDGVIPVGSLGFYSRAKVITTEIPAWTSIQVTSASDGFTICSCPAGKQHPGVDDDPPATSQQEKS